MNPLKLIFRNPTVPQDPPIAQTERNIHTASPDRDGVALAVSKALRQLEFIARSYALVLCDANMDDLKADMETMLRFDDLSSIRLELLGRDGLVLFEFKLHFNAGTGSNGKIIDTGNGIELPVLDRALVAGKRLILQRNGRESTYKTMLRLNWGDAPNIAKSGGAEYQSDHAARISGGRQAAKFFVTDAARHRFIVTHSGPKYGFAKDLTNALDGIFILPKQMPAELAFQTGTHFTGVLVQTPKGMQVRSVRPA